MHSKPPNLFEYIICREKQLNLGDVQVIAREMLLALQLIHSKGIYHLDVNPMNLLVIDDIENCQPTPTNKESG